MQGHFNIISHGYNFIGGMRAGLYFYIHVDILYMYIYVHERVVVEYVNGKP